MDLDAPLGMGPPRPRRRLPLMLAGVAATVVTVAVVSLLATADPHGGEPYAVATLPPAAQPPALSAAPSRSPADPTPTGSLAQSSALPLALPPAVSVAPSAGNRAGPPFSPPGLPGTFDEGTVENGVRVFRGAGPAPTHGPLVIDVTRQLGAPLRVRDAPPAAAPAAALGSSKPGGGLAKPGGGLANTGGGLPKVAIYVGGMGMSPAATQAAIDAMPPAVTLAFVPYGTGLPATVAAATAKGHEVLLQLPMQNTGGSSPGPHALRPGEPAEALADDLGWLLGRFGDYDGLTNLLGAPVTADAATMTGILKAAAGRGLFFVEDGTATRSLVLDVAAQQQVPAMRADVVLDATADPAVVRANLDRLVEIARRKGFAIGMASGLPEHLSAIARFALELPGKNISLVPVGVLARGGASVATITR